MSVCGVCVVVWEELRLFDVWPVICEQDRVLVCIGNNMFFMNYMYPELW